MASAFIKIRGLIFFSISKVNLFVDRNLECYDVIFSAKILFCSLQILVKKCLHINPRGPCLVTFTQNVPGVWDSSELHSTGTLRSGSNGQ